MNKEQIKAQAEALLNEKLSDEELDGVAGGSFSENQDILVAMMDVDPNGTMNLLKEWDQRADDAKNSLNNKLTTLINKNFGKDGVIFSGSADKVGNLYFIGGKRVSHQQFISFLNTTASVSRGGDDW